MAHRLIEMSALESGNAMQHNKFWLWRDPYRNHAERTRLKKILTPGLHKLQLDLSKKPNSFCPPNTDLVVKALIDVNVFELLRANSRRLYWGFLRHMDELSLRLGGLRFDHTPSRPVDKKTGAAFQSRAVPYYRPADPESHTPAK